MASNIQRIEEKKRLRTTSPTGWASKKPVEEVRSDPRVVKLLSLDCKDGNAGVCIVLPPSARMRVGRAGFAQLSLKGVTLWLIWVTMAGISCIAAQN
jgi:hypothetical protein